jgi:ABC-type glycerol-3-phosphate transport system permease component
MQGESATAMAQDCTCLCLASLPIILVYLIFQRQVSQGIVAGGIKD